VSQLQRYSGWILPVGLVVALCVALAFPSAGSAVGSLTLGPLDWASASVVLIFLISGYAMKVSSVMDVQFAKAMGAVVLANLLIPPALAWLALQIVAIPPGLAVGVAVMASVPTTLSTATVISVVAGGDRGWAVGLTVTSVCVGAFTAPFAFSLILASDVAVPALPLLVKIGSIVIIPLSIGFVAARILRRDPVEWVFVIPSLAVIGVVWVTLSQSHDEIVGSSVGRLALLVTISLVGHLVLLSLGYGASRSFAPDQGKSVFFVVAQKTLPLALSLIVAATAVTPALAAVASVAVLLCVTWHFVQLLIDSVIAGRMKRTITMV
jgi:predicted Na+-dependent transporter